MKFTLLMSFVFTLSLSAMAQQYSCDIIDTTGSEENDQWYAIVNLKNKTVQLSSQNGIFGSNPFAVLTLAPQKIKKNYFNNLYVFSGNNKRKYFQKDLYILTFDQKKLEINFESYESNNTTWFANGSCRSIRD